MQIVYGRALSGKSTALFETLAQTSANGEKSILIVPEQISFRTEKRLAEKGFFGGLVEVLSFTKLAKRTLAAQPQAKQLISTSGKTMLMYRALAKASSKLKMYHRAADKATLAPNLLKLAEEFSHVGIHAQMLAEYAGEETPLSAKMADLSMVFENYEALMQESFVDADGMLMLCAQALLHTDAYKNTRIFIDEFADFSAPHFEVVRALANCAKSLSVYVCADKDLDAQGFFAPGANTVQRLKKTFPDAELIYLEKQYAEGAAAHLERYYTKYSGAAYAHKQEEILMFEGRNPYAEMHFAANEILRLCREKGYRFRDFAVVVGDGERYFESIAYIFKRYGIPLFVSAKKSAASHPLALAVLSALEIAERGFLHDAVFAYLKSGFANVCAQDVDFLENYVLATGIGQKHWTREEAWSYKSSYFEEKNEADAARADALRRQIVEPLLTLKASIGISHTVKESAKAIYAFLCSIGMREKTEKRIERLKTEKDFTAASIYLSTYNGVMQVLEQLAALCGDEKCGIARLRNMIEAGLLGQHQAIVPQRMDEVNVTDVAQGRFAECKIMFALGTNAGAFSGFSGSEGILSDADRMGLRDSGLSVLPTARQKAFDHRYTVYKTLTCAGERLYVCYPVSDMSGKPLPPSPIAAKLRKLFVHLPQCEQSEGMVRSAQEGRLLLANELSRVRQLARVQGDAAQVAQALQAQDAAFLELLSHCADSVVQAKRLTQSNLETMYPADLSMSVTRLEKYSACPFSYFMSYMLNARERKVSRIGAPDIGNMVHRALEYFVDVAQQNGESIAKMPTARVNALVGEVSARVTEEMFAGMASVTKSAQYFAKRLQVNLERCVQILVRHIALGKFEPVGSEVHFGDHGDLKAVAISLTNGKKIKIHGVIDRLDQYKTESGTYYRVVDYKTGSKSFSMDNIANGLDFQLMIYMEAALAGDDTKKPAAVLYFKIREPMLSKDCLTDPETIAAEIRKSMRMDGFCIDEPEILEAMDSAGAQESEVFNLKYNKDGSIAATSSVGSMKLFSCMAKRVRRSVRAVGDGLMKGEIAIMPVRTSKLDACQYCPQKPVCLNAAEGIYVKTFENDNLSAKEDLLREGGAHDGN
ncbi:MAG: PD-(D/E)XK nuclease family protein [Clostridia bacterium]|nr:PD-(D/E)XK nuclease family protein [Clostridia bacterium]